MALDLAKLQEFDPTRLRELDRRVDDDVNGEVLGRKRAIEESRAKKRKKAAKKSRGKGPDSGTGTSSGSGGGGGGRGR
ncbi:MAG: hypothetical protein IT204_23605 [Fimbriimonadaceae bacterium]|nr:hypothetical protein [Fimbriimonadaceae bacterium]